MEVEASLSRLERDVDGREPAEVARNHWVYAPAHVARFGLCRRLQDTDDKCRNSCATQWCKSTKERALAYFDVIVLDQADQEREDYATDRATTNIADPSFDGLPNECSDQLPESE
jgi:hypothetical protein